MVARGVSVLFTFLLHFQLVNNVVGFDFNGVSLPRKFPFDEKTPINELKLESAQCANETQTFSDSLMIVGKLVLTCGIFGNCTSAQNKQIADNFYAVRQIDAFGRLPMPGLFELANYADGSYAECRDISGVRYRTNYCYVILMPASTNSCAFANPLASIKRAVCMPYSCGPNDIVTLYNKYFRNPLLTACKASCFEQDVPKDAGFWIFTAFLIIMTILVVVASLADYVRTATFGLTSEKDVSVLLKLLFAFSMYTNAGVILSVKEPKAGHVRSLDCIRLFSMSWVVTGHIIIGFVFSDEYRPMQKIPKNILNDTFINAFVSVDTFFVLSGIVVAYLFFKTRLKPNVVKSPITWILFYIHRYLRLTPPLMLFIGFFVIYGPYLQGPFNTVNPLQVQIDVCKSTWWRNLIYVNNWDNFNGCYGPSWYLAVDTQIYLIVPIFLVAFYLSFYAGLASVVLGCTVSSVICYVMVYKYDLPPTPLGLDPHNKFASSLYQAPWIRCTPYFIGLIAGYILAVFGQRPIRLGKRLTVLVIVGWMFAFAVGLACIYSINSYDNGTHWSKFARATYYNFHRIGWAFAVSWVVVANHLGWGGPINDFMSHPIWQPFGRLSYCAYIVHWMTLYYVFSLLDRPLHYVSLWQCYINYAVPTTMLAYFFAFFWSCYFELPVLKLEKMLIDGLIGRMVPAKASNKVGGGADDVDSHPQAPPTVKDTQNVQNEAPEVAWQLSPEERSPTIIEQF